MLFIKQIPTSASAWFSQEGGGGRCTRASPLKPVNLMAEILLIDDEKQLRLFLQSALTARGHHVIDRDSAEAALEVLANEECDLVVVDEMMPGLHGSELIKILRGQGNDVPVILMTGLATRE